MALWTPTDAQGQLLGGALRRHVGFLKGHGVDGLMALGSTGEFPRFDLEARRGIAAAIVAAAAPLPVMVNVSSNRPQDAIVLGREAREAGAAAIALLPPSYYRICQEDLVAYFLAVSQAVDLPVLLYNFPERTGNTLALESVAAIASRVPVFGIKQSGGEFAFHADLAALGRERGFAVFTGADTRLPEAMALGASGCIGGLANAAPEWVVEVIRARGQGESAGRAHGHLAELGRRIEALDFPLQVAAAVEARGFTVGAPKTVLSEATRNRYVEIVRGLRAWFGERGLSTG